MSADGSEIVRQRRASRGSGTQRGIRDLRDALSGANLEAWSFSRVAGIASDGAVVVGTANYVGAGQVSLEGRAFVAYRPLTHSAGLQSNVCCHWVSVGVVVPVGLSVIEILSQLREVCAGDASLRR